MVLRWVWNVSHGILDELIGPTNVEDRTAERDALRDKLDHMRSLQPLIHELQSLRKQLDMPPRVFEEGELDRDDADQMLQHEIDELKKLMNRRGEADALAAEIQSLRKELQMEPRVFTVRESHFDHVRSIIHERV